MSKYRNLISIVWRDFLKSFKVAPRQYLGDLKGEDHLGNKYFELAADPRGGRRKSSRWFEAVDPTDLTPEIPREWMAWLRRQREVPPTHDEIVINMAKVKLKQQNAAKINEKFNHKDVNDKSGSSFPQYPEYHDSSRFRSS